MVYGAASHVLVLHNDSPAKYDGYQRLSRDQSAERPRMVAAVGVYRQHPLRTRYPQVIEGGIRHLCGYIRCDDHHPLPEYRRNRIP